MESTSCASVDDAGIDNAKQKDISSMNPQADPCSEEKGDEAEGKSELILGSYSDCNTPSSSDLNIFPVEWFEKIVCRGSGTFGVVYQCYLKLVPGIKRNPLTWKYVALKLFRMENPYFAIGCHLAFTQKLEWETLRNIFRLPECPHVAKYHGFVAGPNNIPCGILMELFEGNLSDALYDDESPARARLSPWNRSMVTSILRQCALGVAHLHNHGIVHGNIKPQNVMVCSTGIKIADYSLLKWFTSFPTQAYCSFAALQESDYLAPELLHQSPVAYSTASDVYALGILAEELLSTNLFEKEQNLQGMKAEEPDDDTEDTRSSGCSRGKMDFLLSLEDRKSRAVEGNANDGENDGTINEIIKAMRRKNPSERPDASEIVRMFDAAILLEASRNTPLEPSVQDGGDIDRDLSNLHIFTEIEQAALDAQTLPHLCAYLVNRFELLQYAWLALKSSKSAQSNVDKDVMDLAKSILSHIHHCRILNTYRSVSTGLLITLSNFAMLVWHVARLHDRVLSLQEQQTSYAAILDATGFKKASREDSAEILRHEWSEQYGGRELWSEIVGAVFKQSEKISSLIFDRPFDTLSAVSTNNLNTAASADSVNAETIRRLEPVEVEEITELSHDAKTQLILGKLVTSNGESIDDVICGSRSDTDHDAHKSKGELVTLKLQRKDEITVATAWNAEYEAQLLQELRHDSIVQCHAMFEASSPLNSSSLGLVLESCLGTVQQALEGTCASIPQDLKSKMRIFQDIVSGVAFMHRMGFVHQDLSCSNLLLNSTGHVKISGFTKVSRVQAVPRYNPPIDKYIEPEFLNEKENLAYLAPEARLASQYFAASDVYALAIIGKALFEGKCPKALDFHRLLQVHPPGDPALSPAILSLEELGVMPLGELQIRQFEQIVLSLKSLCQDMWHWVPEDRPSTQMVLWHLEALREVLEIQEPKYLLYPTLSATGFPIGIEVVEQPQSPPNVPIDDKLSVKNIFSASFEGFTVETAKESILKSFDQRKFGGSSEMSSKDMLQDIFKQLTEMVDESTKSQRPICGIVRLLASSYFFAVVVTWRDADNTTLLSMAYYVADIDVADTSTHGLGMKKGVLLVGLLLLSVYVSPVGLTTSVVATSAVTAVSTFTKIGILQRFVTASGARKGTSVSSLNRTSFDLDTLDYQGWATFVEKGLARRMETGRGFQILFGSA